MASGITAIELIISFSTSALFIGLFSKKIIVFKMKAKKNYRKKQGHRQAYTKVTIKEIVA